MGISSYATEVARGHEPLQSTYSLLAEAALTWAYSYRLGISATSALEPDSVTGLRSHMQHVGSAWH